MEIYIKFTPLLSLITAYAITYFAVPAIVRLSLVKKLYDIPDERKQHGRRITALGGIALFAGVIFSFVFFSSHLTNPALNSIIAALGVLFVTGVKDDLFPLVPYKKLIGQIIAVLIVSIQGNIRIVSIYNLYDTYYTMPYWISIALTTFFFLAIINSFNFIDGINGLLSSITIIICAVYAYWFYIFESPLFLILALSVCGALLAFLRYNLLNAKVFMGDSGSMVLGFLVAVLTIIFIQRANEFGDLYFYNIHGMVFAFSVIIIPIFDMVRVVFIRVVLNRKSPFNADRIHIHHQLLDLGLSHFQSTMLLSAVNILIIYGSWLLNESGILAKYQLLIIVVTTLSLSLLPSLLLKSKKAA